MSRPKPRFSCAALENGARKGFAIINVWWRDSSQFSSARETTEVVTNVPACHCGAARCGSGVALRLAHDRPVALPRVPVDAYFLRPTYLATSERAADLEHAGGRLEGNAGRIAVQRASRLPPVELPG